MLLLLASSWIETQESNGSNLVPQEAPLIENGAVPPGFLLAFFLWFFAVDRSIENPTAQCRITSQSNFRGRREASRVGLG